MVVQEILCWGSDCSRDPYRLSQCKVLPHRCHTEHYMTLDA
jgi:hypothetical protein